MASADILAFVMKMISALAVVMGLMMAAAYVFKKVFRQGGSGPADENMIRILSTRFLGPKSSVMVMEVAGYMMVVGVTPQQMTLLATISDQETMDRIRETVDVRPMFNVGEKLLNLRTKLISVRTESQAKNKKNPIIL
jgi:flagellar protein FliO/FliZ